MSLGQQIKDRVMILAEEIDLGIQWEIGLPFKSGDEE